MNASFNSGCAYFSNLKMNKEHGRMKTLHLNISEVLLVHLALFAITHLNQALMLGLLCTYNKYKIHLSSTVYYV